jgi:acyl-CoA thioesterase
MWRCLPGTQRCWLRAPGGLPDDAALHAALLAYVSDLTITIPAYHPSILA